MTLGSDAVEFEWTGSGTGAVVAGVPLTHRRTPPNADEGPVEYFIRHTTVNQWERGAGTWSVATQTLTRVTVLTGSSGAAFVDFAVGTKIVSWVMGADVIAAALDYEPANY